MPPPRATHPAAPGRARAPVLTAAAVAIVVVALAAGAGRTRATPIPQASALVQRGSCFKGFPYSLDYGLVFARTLGDGSLQWQAACPAAGVFPDAAFFAPARPTLVLTHGLAHGGVAAHEEMYQIPDVAAAAAAYARLGANVAFFLWTEFADQPLQNFMRAEDAIYTTAGFVGMEYTVAVEGRPGVVEARQAALNRSIARILADDWVALTRHYYPRGRYAGAPRPTAVWAGHSLGGQLVLAAASEILTAYVDADETGIHLDFAAEDAERLLPDEINLLDAVFSPMSKAYLALGGGATHALHVLTGGAATNAGAAGQIARRLYERGALHGTATSAVVMYTSSVINECLHTAGRDPVLEQYAAAAWVRFRQYGELAINSCFNEHLLDTNASAYLTAFERQVRGTHLAIVPYFLLSANPGATAHRCVTGAAGSVCRHQDSLALTAAMSVDEAREWILPDAGDAPRCFLPDPTPGGRAAQYDVDPSNDYYIVAPCSHASLH